MNETKSETKENVTTGGVEKVGTANDTTGMIQLHFGNNREGWICPRCKKSNSPDVKNCDCSGQSVLPTYVPYYVPSYPCSPYPYPTIICGTR